MDNAAWGFGISLGLALLGIALRAMTVSGAAAGVVLATATSTGLGWRGLALLATFVVLASALTRLGYGRKAALGLAEPRGGRRGAKQAIANLSVPAGCALAAALVGPREMLTMAFAGALAAALADTSGTEIGKLWGRRAYSPLSWRLVEPGTPGGVSLQGLLGSMGGGALIAAVAMGLELLSTRQALGVALAGLVGAYAESVLHTALRKSGGLDHDVSNFLNTLLGAWAAALLA